MQPTIFCLMGPTASGKTPLAVQLVERFPCEIISVDSAMVYRGMDIGTAKPDKETLKRAPHRLIDIADPSEIYSAGRFRLDALREIKEVMVKGRIPLLVGGTMLYFRILQQGLAPMPKADQTLRAQLQKRAEVEGWEALHQELARIDEEAAARIHQHDSQRIQRALEVYLLTGKNLSSLQKETNPLSDFKLCSLALIPTERETLHQKIKERFHHMLELGLVEEVHHLFTRGDLSSSLPAIRSVGYKQIWSYLSGDISFDAMQHTAITATRQLAKRQLTWLRSWPNLTPFPAESTHLLDQVTQAISQHLT